MRTESEILAEIKKVFNARKAAEKKLQRCDDRLKVLHNELGNILLSLLLTACGGNKLSGTYYSTDGISQTFTFKGDTVTMSAFGINATGTYKIDGDKITISYSLFGIPYDWQQSFSKSGDSIYIGGTQFIKE